MTRTPPQIPAFVHLRRAKDLMDRRYADPLDVATLAETALASPAHFIRSFKKAFGETPAQYLTRRRIERAKDLLRNGRDLSVTEVSLEVGYRSLGSFSSAFSELVGESPRAYSRRWEAGPPAHVPACFTLMWTRPADRAVSEKNSNGAGGSVAEANNKEVSKT